MLDYQKPKIFLYELELREIAKRKEKIYMAGIMLYGPLEFSIRPKCYTEKYLQFLQCYLFFLVPTGFRREFTYTGFILVQFIVYNFF